VIYLDMDGVIANFNQAFLDLVPNHQIKHDDLNEWDVWKCVGMKSNQELWDMINNVGHEWWANLQPYPWFMDLVAGLQEIAPVCLLSSPGWSPDAAKGKLQWIQRYFGTEFEDWIFTSQKHHVAKVGTILIDDKPGNCRNFKYVKGKPTGGMSLLFPQPWNKSDAEGLFRPDRVTSIIPHVDGLLSQ
jgi:5'(3')-deoxyribonucleotidase